MKNKLMILAVTALAVLVLCAGCVSDTSLKTTETTIPIEMYDALDELSDDFTTLEHAFIKDLNTLSEKIRISDKDEIHGILTEYYSSYPCFTAVIYRNINEDIYISSPVFVDIDLSEYAVLEEEDFKNAGGMIARDNIFTRYHGYQNLYYKPVYNEDGKYQGYVVLAVDAYSMIYLHPLMLGQDKKYSEYICFITNKDDEIIYSSIEEAIGKIITEDGYYDGLAYIPKVNSGDSACKYDSVGFYSYGGDILSEKITAWHTIYSSHGNRYTFYLIDSPNESEMETEDVFTLNTQQALNDIRGAYVYASLYGKEMLMERINSGYYKTHLYINDMRGNVVASSDKKAVWNNYLNNHGVYGVPFINFATLTAELGSGYIYYLAPAERTVSPYAAQFTYGIVMGIDENYFLYCKTPGSVDAVINDKNLIPDLNRAARNVLKDTYIYGVDAVAESINSMSDDALNSFSNGDKTNVKDIAILDVDGNVYASVGHPELVGKSATFMTDAYGSSVTRKSDLFAKTGGGYLTVLYENKDKEGYVDLYISLIEPIDSKYYIFTFTFIDTFEDILTPAIENTIPTE